MQAVGKAVYVSITCKLRDLWSVRTRALIVPQRSDRTIVHSAHSCRCLLHSCMAVHNIDSLFTAAHLYGLAVSLTVSAISASTMVSLRKPSGSCGYAGSDPSAPDHTGSQAGLNLLLGLVRSNSGAFGLEPCASATRPAGPGQYTHSNGARFLWFHVGPADHPRRGWHNSQHGPQYHAVVLYRHRVSQLLGYVRSTMGSAHRDDPDRFRVCCAGHALDRTRPVAPSCLAVRAGNASRSITQ